MAGVTAVASSLASYHKGWVDLCLFTNLSVPYDRFALVSQFHLYLPWGQCLFSIVS